MWVFVLLISIFMTGYYDLVLGLIPLALAGITGVLTGVASLELTTAIPLASLVAVGLIGHAMFVRAPVDSPPTAAATSEPLQAAD
mgnify:CR=1 FL=1